jgi:hypothetical protein
METQNSYKRTVAGSVGAGMGAIFNGSGRTYYILEHKTSSKYHQAGETQKIIIDQIELGRDASCQVRFDESLDTVSRKHAAIVKEGNGWKLVHLSQSNPTLVNGQPIQGQYFLQSGDEIQLSAGGPRMGFIQPQGAQALTSSIKLTERMNLFRQQALRPYRTAIWVLAGLLLLSICGFGAWNYKLTQDNQELMAQAEQLIQQSADLDKQINLLEQQIKDNPENAELKQQMEELKQQKQQVQTRYTTVYRDNPALQRELSELKKQVGGTTSADEDDDDTDEIAEDKTDDNEVAKPSDNSSDNIENYYQDVYTLKVDRITIEWNGKSIVPEDIVKSDVIVGTAFVTPGGNLVTSRSNLEPWIYGTGSWCDKLAWCQSIGANIVIDYLAYSTRGTGHPLRFKNTDFNLNALHAHDVTEEIIVNKEVTKTWELYGIIIAKKEYKSRRLYRTKRTPESYCAGSLAMGAPGGLPLDNAKAQSLKGGEEVLITGFNGNPNIHNLTTSIKYFSSRTSRNAEFRLITLQDTYSNAGYTGSPVFCKDSNGNYRVVGVNVGNHNGETYVARITDVKR